MAVAAQPGSAAGCTLTKQQALELQERFIGLYSKEDFQERLREAWGRAGGDAKLQDKARQDLCLPVQGTVLEQFGFNGTRAGVMQALAAFGPLESDPEVAAKNRTLAYLTNPGVAAKAASREASAKALPKEADARAAPKDAQAGGDLAAGQAPASSTAPVPSGSSKISPATTASTSAASSSPPSRSPETPPPPARSPEGGALDAAAPRPPAATSAAAAEDGSKKPAAARGKTQEVDTLAKASDFDANQSSTIPPLRKYSSPDNEPGEGQLWVVVGGGSVGGIKARSDKEVHSTEFKIRLQTGARVEEMELVGERLHYRRLRGDGPDFGWVSLSFKGAALLVKIEREDFQSGWSASGQHGGLKFG